MHFGCLLYCWKMFSSVIVTQILLLDVMLSSEYSKIFWLKTARGSTFPQLSCYSFSLITMMLWLWTTLDCPNDAELLLILMQWGLMFHLLPQNGSYASSPKLCLQRLENSLPDTCVYLVRQWCPWTHCKMTSQLPLLLLWTDNPASVGYFIQWRSKGLVPCRSSNFQGESLDSLPIWLISF